MRLFLLLYFSILSWSSFHGIILLNLRSSSRSAFPKPSIDSNKDVMIDVIVKMAAAAVPKSKSRKGYTFATERLFDFKRGRLSVLYNSYDRAPTKRNGSKMGSILLSTLYALTEDLHS